MKNVIVTGGANGIGRGIVSLLAQKGYRVFIADTDEEAGQTAALEYGAFFVRTDCADEASVMACCEKASERGHIHALINNAGIASPARLHLSEVTLEEWRRVMDVNLTGAFLFAKYASLKMGRGYIVNIASTRAFQSEENTFAYTASKGGLVSLTHCLAVSLGPKILVNCISPGWINTNERYIPTARDLKQHPAGRVGAPSDIAELAAFLIGGKADFITGQNFTADGGMTVKMIYDED